MKSKTCLFICLAATACLAASCNNDVPGTPETPETPEEENDPIPQDVILHTIAPGDTARFTADNTPVSAEVKTFVVNAVSYRDWVYFSFVTGDSVEVAQPYNSWDWDIAFHRYDMQTNGGKTGIGKAGVIMREEQDFATLFTLPETGYYVDKIDSINYTGMPPMNTVSSKNRELSRYMEVDTENMPPQYKLYPNVFVIRTAKGRYAKLRFTDYRDDKNVKGYIRIEYIYPVK